MTKPEFPGTAVGMALSNAVTAWHDKLPAVAKDLTLVIERDSAVSVDALRGLVNQMNFVFYEKLYRELQEQGLII